MDPSANLAEIRRIAAHILKCADSDEEYEAQDAERLAVLVEALDQWISKGGFLPARWSR